jgi:cytoskeletal protein CcmA (bactofilin family)
MTQYVINIGAIPNDGTGDPLRTAFNETNLNFDQVFTAGPVLSNIQIANNKILTTNTNGNLILAPNGTGVVQSNVSIVPNLANLRNLGSSTQRWATVYTQYLNVSTGTSINGDLSVAGNLTVQGNIIQIGNLVTDSKTIQLANTAGTANAADGSGITVGANDNIATMLYSSATNAWTFNIGVDTPNIVVNNISSDDSTFVTIQDGLDVQGSITAETLSVAGNVTGAYFIGNGSQLTGLAATYGNANAVAYGESGWAGNIVPNGNAVYSLGNATNQWNDLYVSNATIFMNNVPISLTASNVLTIDGEAVLTNDSNTTITTTGNITADYFFGNTEGLIGNITNLDSVNFAVENIGALVGNNGVNIGAGGNNNLVVLPNEVLIQNVPLTVAGNILSTVAGGLNITANTVANGTAQIWNFGTDGRLTFPGTPRIDTDANNFEVQAAENISLEANAVVNIYTDTSGAAYQWQFGNDGNLTVAANGNINGADGEFVRFQSLEEGVVRSGVILNPGDGLVRLESWDSEDNQNFTTSDWSSATYVTGGIGGEIAFVDAPNIINFINSIETSRVFLQVNGGTPVPYDGYSSGGNNITFSTTVAPEDSPETVTDFVIYYSIRSRMEMDYDEGELNITARGLDLTINGDQDVDIQSGDRIRIENSSTVNGITISTDVANAFRTWTFDVAGNLNLPASGNLVGTTPNNNGYLSWNGNSSGDGNGYTTLKLVPDDTREGSDQYLVIDPTAPGHIHIRAGGTQDNSSADLILGGENSFVKIAASANSDVFVRSNSNDWRFGTDGVLTLPAGEGVLQSTDDTISLVSFNTTTGNANSVYLGTSGGLGFFDQEAGGNWLEIFRSGSEPEIRVPVGLGNLNIQTASANTPYNWTFDNTGSLTLPGGSRLRPLGANLDIFAGTGSYVNLITSDESSYMGVGGAGGYVVTAGGTWDFNTNGNLTAPGNVSAVGNITSGNLTVGSGTITGGNVNGAIFNGNVAFGTGTVGGSGNITGGNLITTGSGGNITMSGGNITGANVVTANSFVGNGATLSNVATQVTGSWTVPVGNSTQSFTVSPNETYYLWVEGNIPNGIIAWNATATITNTNVPVVGAQYAWVYNGNGTPIDFVSIPNQFIGTANTIVRGNVAPSGTTNRFDFGINNTSGNTVTVNYGYTKIS